MRSRHLSQPLVADKCGKVFELDGYTPMGMKAGLMFPLERHQLLKIHPDSELFVLPDRIPVVGLSGSKEAVEITKDPHTGEDVLPVAAFLPPGYTATHTAAYREMPVKRANRRPLPLFSYAPAVFRDDGIYAPCVRTDPSRRHELAAMDTDKVASGVEEFRSVFPNNRLARHLERCALEYGCPAGKNFFLGRHEAPLPISPLCNISCLGCISYQQETSCCQERISFTPTAEEVAELAVHHLDSAEDPVVSFGQGCEGEPLMAGEVLKRSVGLIRQRTSSGMVNLNTNATRPELISELFDSGLDSIRVTLNSFQQDLYSRYIGTDKYPLEIALRSMRTFRSKGGFVSVNYLVFPGLTDWDKERKAFFGYLKEGIIDMVQWRNLNIDPYFYRRKLKLAIPAEEMTGVAELIDSVKINYPCVMNGYFNPTRAQIEDFRNNGSTTEG